MAIVIRYMCCLVFISRSSDLIQYGGIVTKANCIKTTKPILKLFRPSGSPVILISSYPCDDTQFQGELIQRGR